MVRGWLDRGVDGFRLDTFNVFLKHPDAALQPAPRAGRTAWTRQEHRYDFDQPDLPALARSGSGRSSTPTRADDGRRAVRRARPRARPR